MKLFPLIKINKQNIVKNLLKKLLLKKISKIKIFDNGIWKSLKNTKYTKTNNCKKNLNIAFFKTLISEKKPIRKITDKQIKKLKSK